MENKIKKAADIDARYGPPEARQINIVKRNTFMRGALWYKNHGTPPSSEITEGEKFEIFEAGFIAHGQVGRPTYDEFTEEWCKEEYKKWRCCKRKNLN